MVTLVEAKATTRAMSCGATVVVRAASDDRAAALADDAVVRIHELERRWTRFSATSELSRLNAASRSGLRVSGDTVRLVEAMVQAWYVTGGAFDPTLLCPLVELGYAASRDDVARRTSLAPGWDGRGRVAEILVDRAAGEVRLPAGTVVDPGGVGKGVAADIVSEELIAAGAAGALVEIGGDLTVRGAAPASTGWSVAVAGPLGDGEQEVVELASGAVATSSSRFRTWTDQGERRHHLLDPRTLRPTTSEVVACTVIAGTAAWAEAFTKVAFVDGAADALDRYDLFGLAARVTTDDGAHRHSGAWGRFGR